MKDWVVKQSKHKARYQRVHCLIIFYTIIKIQYAYNYRDRGAVKKGHLAVITDRKGHFKTCHFNKSVQMSCIKHFEYLFYSHISNKEFMIIQLNGFQVKTRGFIVVGRYWLLHFLFFFILLFSWARHFSKVIPACRYLRCFLKPCFWHDSLSIRLLLMGWLFTTSADQESLFSFNSKRDGQDETNVF